MALEMKFTADQLLAAKYHFGNGADEANVAYFIRESMSAANGSFHTDQMVKHLSRACLAMGVTVDASGKVEKIATAVVEAPFRGHTATEAESAASATAVL